MKTILAAAITLCLTGCNVYNSEFQCRPGKGVGCAPVGEVLDMIVESEEGEDQFTKDKTAIKAKQSASHRQKNQTASRLKRKRISKQSKKTHSQKTLTLTKDETGRLVLQPEK